MEVFQRTATARALAGVVGVRISVNPHFFVRPEFEIGKAGEFLTMGGTVARGGSL